ncbi:MULTISPECIES: ATP-binding protein [Pseudoalteromonas]|uniref:ATP-binding protein n=1 Tax=Pseudoalteromonas TaxID=53246 RepID=UPI000FFEF473|nr:MULTISPECIES: ATP-binding protein [Pseudoalteromonas]MCG9761394.1 ATP-binding protein [Pseudoalteromonas sp. Isolate6]NKC21046.1 response regulator [Pseudoalteromonas galatheae]RXE87785.1 hybrid sensor histidine kinase/response regulator [Pseudoalteromonas sp. A757]
MLTALKDSMPILIVTSEWYVSHTTTAAEKLLVPENNIVNKHLEDLFTFPSCVEEQQKTIADGSLIQVSLRTSPNVQFLLSFYDVHSNEIFVHIAELSTYYCQNPLEDEQTRILRHAVNSANLGVWCYDLLNKTAYFSPKFKSLIGLPASAELDWETLKSMIYQEDQPLFSELLSHHIEQGLMLHFEFRLEVRGSIHWFELKGEQVKYCIRTHSVYGILADCTHEKDMLVALHDAEESKELAMQAGKIGTWRAIRVANQWIWNWDHQANEIFKLSEDDIGNLHLWEASLHPDDKARVIQALEASLSSGEIFEQRYRGLLNDKDIVVVYAKGVVGLDEYGRPSRIDGVVIDQTDVYIAQKKLQHINQELEQRVAERTADLEAAIIKAEQASRTKSDFLSMMSHELRTPMNGIIGSLDLMSLSELDEDNQELLETASISANNLVSILNDILDLAKVEQGKMELESYPFSPSKMLNNIIKTFEAHARDKSVKLTVHEDIKLPLEVIGDENRVRQIIFNVVSNAIKFSVADREGGAKVTITVHWASEGVALSHLIFKIEDNGIGIAPEVQKKLFTPFTQAERSITRKYGGTGLGLAICGKLIDLMGGKVALKSKSGEGSTFTITIPVWCPRTQQQPNMPFNTLYWLSDACWQSSLALTQLYNACTHFCSELKIVESPNEIKETDGAALIRVFTTQAEASTKQILSPIPELMFFDESAFANLTSKALTTQKSKPITPQTQYSIGQLLSKLKASQQDDETDLGELNDLSELDALLSLDDKASSPSDDKTNTNGKQHILLAEDNPFNQKLIVKQLSKLGVSCDIANNGKEALAMYKSQQYQLLLTDCHMPEIDGYELAKLIRAFESKEERSAIPIVAVTGAAMKGDKELCLDSGMNDYVSKPVRLQELKNTLGKWLDMDFTQ